MSQTVRIDWKHILSRVRVSVRPSNFLYAKKLQNYREYRVAWYATVYLNEAPTDHCSPVEYEQAKRGVNFAMVGRTPIHRTVTTWTETAVGGYVRECVRVCAGMRACVRDGMDNIIWPRLIMIITKIIILYFIQITHTDDFPLNGFPASY